MEDDKVVLLPLLNGTNFASWKYRMLILLEEKGLSECIQKERKDGDDLSKNDKKCKLLLISRIADSQLEYVRSTHRYSSCFTHFYIDHSTQYIDIQSTNLSWNTDDSNVPALQINYENSRITDNCRSLLDCIYSNGLSQINFIPNASNNILDLIIVSDEILHYCAPPVHIGQTPV